MEFVDKPGAQKSSVGSASSFQQETFYAEFAIEDVQSEGKVEIRAPGKDVGDFFAAQARQVRIGDLLGKHDHDRIAPDVRTAPSNLAVGVQDNAIRLRIPAREPGLARKGLLRRRGIRLALSELLTRDAADQPGVAREVVCSKRFPAAPLGRQRLGSTRPSTLEAIRQMT